MRFLALGALFFVGPVFAAPTFEIAPRDSEALVRALCDSVERRTIIELARESRYEMAIHDTWTWRYDSPNRPSDDKFIILPSCGDRTTLHLQISGNVTIRGNGSILDFESGFGFLVEEGAKLKLEDVELTNASGFGPLYSFGSTTLNRVTIRGNVVTWRGDETLAMATSFGLPIVAPAIHNFGDLQARNVYIGQNSLNLILDESEALCPAGSSSGVYNAGYSRLNNVTFYLNRASYPPPCAYSIYNDNELYPEARVEASNTLYDWVDDACWGDITSLGFNLEPFYSTCGLNNTLGDRPFGQSPDVEERTNTGGITYPLLDVTDFATEDLINRGSPRLSGGHACEPEDIRGFLRHTTDTERCDIGAFEVGASGVAGDLAGTWLSPASDGHYLTITQLEGQNVLMMWNTFDTSGKQLWLYGAGPRDGSQITVDAYRNIGGFVAPGVIGAAEPEIWGQMSFQVNSCAEGLLVSEPLQAGAPGVTMELTRIVESAELHCLGPE